MHVLGVPTIDNACVTVEADGLVGLLLTAFDK